MGLFTSLLSILGGILASSNVIIDKQPNSRELIEKVAPYQAFIGVGLLIMGIITLLKFGSILTIVMSVAAIIVGFLLGYGLLSQYIFSGSETAAERGIKIRESLVQYQIPAGFVLLALGVLNLLRFIF